MKIVALSTLILSLLVGCSNKSNTGSEIKNSEIISDRAQNKSHFIALIRLESPALLTTAKKSGNKTVVSEELKTQILKEQAEMIAKLAEMSSEIKVIQKYRMVLNAIAVLAPIEFEEKFKGMAGVSYVERNGQFARAQAIRHSVVKENDADFATKNSTTFIGADKAHALGITGKGITVGVIDTGIDYTHTMFGGSGNVDEFKNMDPTKDYPELYPNAKVVGGIDLCGTDYNAASPLVEHIIPKPDNNPIDEGGHGTHVAGSVAGIGDNVNTYNGVAPDAKLHAIKVFGKNGSTGDVVITAALEYSADPNGDLDPADKLDVVNLSLGSGYGKPHILYSEAIKNLVNGGTVTVASAGNSGHNQYIVGAPGTVDEAFSVAAGIDNMDHNYKFGAVDFQFGNESLLAEAIEGSITKKIEELDENFPVAPLVYAGVAATDFDEELKAKLKGNVALIDRGAVSFSDKIKRAQDAGAIAIVVANNRAGEPIVMGGDGNFEIPGIMISQALGDQLKKQMETDLVNVSFKSNKTIEKPELIDTLTGFSSQGPRSYDSAIKPEIAAPGSQIISADMGGGNKGVKMSGTSMSGPHVAGVMALMVQAQPNLSPIELKSLVMNTAKTIGDKDKKDYPISQQGAGRVQVEKAVTSKILSIPSALSLGEVQVSKKKVIRKTITLRNLSEETMTLFFKPETKDGLKLNTSKLISIKPNSIKKIAIDALIDLTRLSKGVNELDGFAKFNDAQGNEVLRIPVLAVSKKLSNISANKLTVFATDDNDAAGALSEVELTNNGSNAGEVLMFNLLGTDERKDRFADNNPVRSKTCDLQAAGYRVVNKEGKRFLQFGVKLYGAVTTWQPCQISVLIDADGDEKPEQELAGVIHGYIEGLPRSQEYNSFLLNATKVRELRGKFEQDYLAATQNGTDKPEADYTSAIQGFSEMMTFNHSTVAVIEAETTLLAKDLNGNLNFKLAVLHEDQAAVEADDYLGDMNKWKKINLANGAMAYNRLPAKYVLAPGASQKIGIERGQGKADLLMLFPSNRSTPLNNRSDDQSQILKATFAF